MCNLYEDFSSIGEVHLDVLSIPPFVTEVYVALLAMDLCNITKVVHTSADYHENVQEQMT